MVLERGRAYCEQGNVAPGLLWIARSLRMVPPEDPLEHVIRTDLTSWSSRHYRLRATYDFRGPVVAVSPDGKTVLVAGTSAVEFQDITTGELLGDGLEHPNASKVLFSPDGKTIVTASDHRDRMVRLWNAATRKLVGEPFEIEGDLFEVKDLAFSPDGKKVAIACGRVQVLDCATGAALGATPAAEGDVVHQVLFSGNGKELFIVHSPADEDAYEFQAFDAETLRPLNKGLQHKGLTHMAVSRDSGAVVTVGCDRISNDSSVRLWKLSDPASGRPETTFKLLCEHEGPFSEVQISPDGKTAVTVCRAGNANRLWSLETGEGVATPLVHQDVEKVAFSPDGRLLLTAGNGVVRFWDAATGRPVAAIRPR